MTEHLVGVGIAVGVLLFLVLAALLCIDPIRCTICAEQVRRRDLADHLNYHCPLNRKDTPT
jgi:hypothetical protein